MSQVEKVLRSVLAGISDQNISFHDLCTLLISLGFQERIKGSHHIFFMQGVEEILNIQPQGLHAKAYQVKQIRSVILKYKLGGKLDV